MPTPWIVYMGFSIGVVEHADSEALARQQMERDMGTENKPWIARRWTVRMATEEELRQYAAWADGYRPSEATAKTAKRAATKKPRKSVQERLL